MKTFLTSLLGFVIGLTIFYMMWSFYWVTFDFSKWSENGRGTFVIIGGFLSTILAVIFGVHYYTEVEDND